MMMYSKGTAVAVCLFTSNKRSVRVYK